MRNILIRAYLDRNFGDDIMISLLLNRFPTHQFYIMCARKELSIPFEKFNNLNVIGRQNLNKVVDKYKIDMVIDIGGSLFIIDKVWKNLIYIKKYLDELKVKNKVQKCIIGCNIGPLEPRFSSRILKKYLSSYSLITVRDSISYKFLQKNLHKLNIKQYPDIVFSANVNINKPVQLINNKLGISVYRSISNKHNNHDNYIKISDIVNKYIEKTNNEVILIAFDVEKENDLCAAYTILKYIKEKDKVKIVAHNDDGKNIIEAFKQCKTIIGIRFHSVVLALRLGVNVIPVIYSNKTKSLLEYVDYKGTYYEIEEFNKLDTYKLLSEVEKSERNNSIIDEKIFVEAQNHFNEIEKIINLI